jgi:hypothetical protein
MCTGRDAESGYIYVIVGTCKLHDRIHDRGDFQLPINNKTLFENELTRFYLGSQVVKCSVDAGINDARLNKKLSTHIRK